MVFPVPDFPIPTFYPAARRAAMPASRPMERRSIGHSRKVWHVAVRCRFLVGETFSVADIALYAYTHVADEGGFDLASRPNVKAWLRRCAAALKPEKGSAP